MTTWFAQPDHHAWLARQTADLLAFGQRTGVQGGGAAWLTDDGRPWPERGVHTWITGRTAHVYSLGTLLGLPGARPVAEAALAGLAGPLRDADHGGWFTRRDADGTAPDEKSAYAHAFVVLGTSSAAVAELPGARDLLTQALEVVDRWFWDEEAGRVVDVWDAGFAVLDSYRGVNANMHAVEAFLAAADVTGDRVWLDRAARVGRWVADQASGCRWRVVEHYDETWTAQPDLNADRPDDPFRPFGATVGHGLEWSRLLLHLEAAGVDGEWLRPALGLFDRAVTDGWAVDGADGFCYTTDWTGTPVVRTRLHWVVAEAIAAASALYQRTGETQYAQQYAQWWDYAARYLHDNAHGSWHHELTPDNTPSAHLWPGKADLYHAVQATLLPRLPLAPTLATALAAGLLR